MTGPKHPPPSPGDDADRSRLAPATDVIGDEVVLRSFAVVGATATAVFAPAALLEAPEADAYAWAHVVGVGRLMAGPAGSARRTAAVAEMSASVLRRVARRAGLGNRLRTVRQPGPGPDEVSVQWPAAHAEAARDLATATARLLQSMTAEADEGTYMAAVRAAGDRVGHHTERPVTGDGTAGGD